MVIWIIPGGWSRRVERYCFVFLTLNVVVNEMLINNVKINYC